MDNNNLYKHIVDLYDTKPVTRKEYLIVLVIYSLITLLFYSVPIKFVSALAGLVLVLFIPLLFIATFNCFYIIFFNSLYNFSSSSINWGPGNDYTSWKVL